MIDKQYLQIQNRLFYHFIRQMILLFHTLKDSYLPIENYIKNQEINQQMF